MVMPNHAMSCKRSFLGHRPVRQRSSPNDASAIAPPTGPEGGSGPWLHPTAMSVSEDGCTLCRRFEGECTCLLTF